VWFSKLKFKNLIWWFHLIKSTQFEINKINESSGHILDNDRYHDGGVICHEKTCQWRNFCKKRKITKKIFVLSFETATEGMIQGSSYKISAFLSLFSLTLFYCYFMRHYHVLSWLHFCKEIRSNRIMSL